jgi:hypothetical protein
VLGILLVRNAWMFSVPVYEDADTGAYSIQVEQARRFALLVAAAGAAWRMPAGRLRRFCVALLAVNAASTVAFLGYTATGIDEVNQYYIGYFYGSAPVIMVLVVLVAGTELLAVRWPASGTPRASVVPGLAAALALASCTAFAVAPQTRLSTDHADPGGPAATGPVGDPSLPAGVARIAALAAGRYAVLSSPHAAWPAKTGHPRPGGAHRVPACVAAPAWEFMMTSQFICTSKEIAGGERFSVWAPGSVPRGMPVVFWLRRGMVAYGTK